MGQNVAGMLNTLQSTFQMMSSFLANYGISMEIIKVVLNPKEFDEKCQNSELCIDYVVRIYCDSDYICKKLKEEIKKDLQQSSENNGKE